MHRFPLFIFSASLLSLIHHAERRVGVKCRMVVGHRQRGVKACLLCVERGSIAFDKCEHREATGHTGFNCSSDLFQKIDGFVLRKSSVIQNVLLSEFVTRARRLKSMLSTGRTSSSASLSVYF